MNKLIENGDYMTTLISVIMIMLLSLVLLSLCIIYIMTDEPIVPQVPFYSFMLIGTYFDIIVFRKTTDILKNDILNTVSNTQGYSGFIEPLGIILFALLGSVFGAIYFYLIRYIKQSNIKK